MVYVFFALNAPCGASSYYINKIDIMRKELYKTSGCRMGIYVRLVAH